MTFEVDLPDDADHVKVDAKPDGVYVEVEVFNGMYELLESHTYADGPEENSHA